MKKHYSFLLITTLLLALNYTCKKDDNGESLPPYTEVGANTFTFRVNGKVYETEVGYLPSSPRIHVFYNHIDPYFHNDFRFEIEGNKIYLEDNKNLGIILSRMPKIGIYKLSDDGGLLGSGSYAYYWDNKPIELSYYTDSNHAGELNITRLDTVNHIIAGKFKFNAKRWCLNRECNEVILVDGQFDVQYKPNIGVNYN